MPLIGPVEPANQWTAVNDGFISIAFATGERARALKHSAIESGESREISFPFPNLAGESAPSQIRETFLSRPHCPTKFRIETLGNFQRYRLRRNTVCNTGKARVNFGPS